MNKDVILLWDEGKSSKKKPLKYNMNPYTMQDFKRINEDGSTGGGTDSRNSEDQ